MKEIGAYEAKTHLPKLLEAVRKGEEFSITRRGEPVALLLPIHHARAEVKPLIAEFKKWRKGIRWGKGVSTTSAMKEGRR